MYNVTSAETIALLDVAGKFTLVCVTYGIYSYDLQMSGHFCHEIRFRNAYPALYRAKTRQMSPGQQGRIKDKVTIAFTKGQGNHPLGRLGYSIPKAVYYLLKGDYSIRLLRTLFYSVRPLDCIPANPICEFRVLSSF